MAANERERWDVVQASEHDRWLARPFDDPNGQEVIVLSKSELLHALPRVRPCNETPEPPPAKPPVELKLAYEMTMRDGPGTTYTPIGKLPIGTVAPFTADERPSANGYYWRRIAQEETAWIAEGTTDGSKVYLVNPT